MKTQARKAADRFLQQAGTSVAPGQLRQLLDACAKHLVERVALPYGHALELALIAWSEIEGPRTSCYVDLAASTPHLVVVVDKVAQTRRMIPSADLVRLMGPRAVPAGDDAWLNRAAG